MFIVALTGLRVTTLEDRFIEDLVRSELTVFVECLVLASFFCHSVVALHLWASIGVGFLSCFSVRALGVLLFRAFRFFFLLFCAVYVFLPR